MRSSSAAAVCAATAVLLPVTALGATRDAGGSSIASAVALPVNRVADASTAPRVGVQFWKIDLGVGDMLAVAFASTSGPANTTGICVLPPAVTDATLGQTRCLATLPDIHWTTGRVQVVVVAPTAGTYYLAAGLADCLRAVAPDSVKACETYHGGADPVPALSYQIGGQVLKPTSVTVQAPRHAAVHTHLHLTGTVGGVGDGTVEIALAGPSRFHPIDRMRPLDANGAFALSTPALPRGRYTLTVSYPGDVGHRPAERTVALTVG